MSEPFLGEIRLLGFNFAPRGWAKCDGQLLPVSQNDALFSLLGTVYGGDGRSTFALPDLRGRVPMHFGQGPGLSDRRIGEKSGDERVALSIEEMPPHKHRLRAVAANADRTTALDASLARAREDTYGGGTPDQNMGVAAITNTGGGQSHQNMQPYLALNWCIALVGVYPSRS